MLDITQQKGLSTELQCMLDFTKLGFMVLKPLSDTSKYDLVVEKDNKFYRIQCKSAKWAEKTQIPQSAFEIHTYAVTVNTQTITRHKYSKEDIDYFYTYFNGQGYLVAIEEATGNGFRWRYEYPSTNQKQGIHIAADYKIEEVIKSW